MTSKMIEISLSSSESTISPKKIPKIAKLVSNTAKLPPKLIFRYVSYFISARFLYAQITLFGKKSDSSYSCIHKMSTLTWPVCLSIYGTVLMSLLTLINLSYVTIDIILYENPYPFSYGSYKLMYCWHYPVLFMSTLTFPD